MKQFLILIKIQFHNIFGQNKNLKPSQKFFSTLLIVLFGGMFAFYFYLYFNALGQMGLSRIIMPSAFLVSSIFILFSSTMDIKSTIYDGKDFELLQTLPIKTEIIIYAKMTRIYLEDLLVCLVIMFPAIITYIDLFYDITFIQLIIFLILFLMVPLIPISLGMILAYFLSLLTQKFKIPKVFSSFLSIASVILIYTVLFGNNTSEIGQILANVSDVIIENMRHVYPLITYVELSFNKGDLFSLLKIIIISVVLIIIMVKVLCLKYQFLNTNKFGIKKHKTNFKELSKKGQFKVFYINEMKKFFYYPFFVSNNLMGYAICIFFATLITFFTPSGFEIINEIPNHVLIGIASLFVPFFTGLFSISASMISIEGNNIWLLKSLPINYHKLYLAKIMVPVTFGFITTLIVGLEFIISYKLNFIYLFQILLISLAFLMFQSFFGLYMNLKYPKYDWTNVTEICKNSTSKIITSITIFILDIILFIIAFINLQNIVFITWVYFAIIIIGILCINKRLKRTVLK